VRLPSGKRTIAGRASRNGKIDQVLRQKTATEPSGAFVADDHGRNLCQPRYGIVTRRNDPGTGEV
jgi:hypothetical protein